MPPMMATTRSPRLANVRAPKSTSFSPGPWPGYGRNITFNRNIQSKTISFSMSTFAFFTQKRGFPPGNPLPIPPPTQHSLLITHYSLLVTRYSSLVPHEHLRVIRSKTQFQRHRMSQLAIPARQARKFDQKT